MRISPGKKPRARGASASAAEKKRRAVSRGGPSSARASAGPLRRDGAVAQIRQLIERLSLDYGDRLPSERQLAERFGLSRGTVREALQFLAALDLVEIRHGGGCFIRASSNERGELRTRWRDWVTQHRGQILETLEVRLGCEMFGARLAARRAGPIELAQLAEALRGMKAASETGDVTIFLRSDLAFHAALLSASGNKTLQELVGALGKDLIPERAAILDIAGRAARSFAEHSAIYEAVQGGDTQAAGMAMHAHLESVRRDLMLHMLGETDVDASSARAVPITSSDLSDSMERT